MPAGAPPLAFAGAGGNGTEEPRSAFGAPLFGFTESFAHAKLEGPKSLKAKTPNTPSLTHATFITVNAAFVAKKEGLFRYKIEGKEPAFVSTAAAATAQTADPVSFIVPAGASWEWEGENLATPEVEYFQQIATSP